MKQPTAASSGDLAVGEVERLALAYAAKRDRSRFLALFALDERMRRIVSQAREPLLSQMRLAWWRDQLAEPPLRTSNPDPLLSLVAGTWTGEERSLVALINGWEGLLGEPPLAREAFAGLIDGRAEAAAGLARLVEPAADGEAVRLAARCWAAADLMARLSAAKERDTVREMATALPGCPPRLPRSLRPLAVLSALGARAISRGGGPLLARRSDALWALRAGLLGR